MSGTLEQVLMTAVTLIVLIIALGAVRYQISRFTCGNKLKQSRGKLANKVIAAFLVGIAVVVLIYIWGINTRHLWALLTGILGIVAIAFFAVWSMLSNIIAGFLLFISDAFKIGDVITILPDAVSGTVLELKLLFVVLEDKNGDVIHIPNTLFFQKIIKRQVSPKAGPPGG